MKIAFYQLLHVLSMVLLTAVIFELTVKNPQLGKPRSMRSVGVLGILMLIGGFGLLAVMKVGFPWWILVKLGCWLGVVVVGGLACRQPLHAAKYRWLFLGLITLAITTVYLKNHFASYE